MSSWTFAVLIGFAIALLSLLIRVRRRVRVLSETLTRVTQAMDQRVNALTTQRNQATAILESMAEGVMAINRNGTIALLNPAVERLLSLTTQQTVGQHLVEAIRVPEIQDMARAVLQQPQRASRDIRIFHPSERWLRIHMVPCQGSGDMDLYAVLVIQDITQYHQYEQLRKEFVANVSHELTSPLTSIRSLTETLLTGALQDSANNRRFVQLIDEDARRLTQLIDDLLALSQLESQAVPLHLAPIDLKPLVESVAESLQTHLQQRRISVQIQLPESIRIQADADRLRQVLYNLIDNALKYNTDGGTITIATERSDGWITVRVTDTGIGIPAHDLPRIFERFYRVDKARSRELGGTGLGLSIVKHIVEAHGGRVSVASQLGQGSTFTVTFPTASPPT